jgi:hypothetical protein
MESKENKRIQLKMKQKIEMARGEGKLTLA